MNFSNKFHEVLSEIPVTKSGGIEVTQNEAFKQKKKKMAPSKFRVK